MKAAEGAAAQMAALRLQVEQARAAHRQTAVPCGECDQTATLFCEQCDGEFCSAHSQQVHSLKQSHNVMRVEEKAGFLAGKFRRDAEGKAQNGGKKCALHPDQPLYLYCSDCRVSICAVCMHGRHKKHALVDIDEAAAEARKLFESQLAQVAGNGAKNGGGAGSVNGIGGGGGISTLADVERLAGQLQEMKQGPRTAQRAAGSGGSGALSTVAAFATVVLSDSNYLSISLCFPFVLRRPLVVGRGASRRGVAGRGAEGRGGPPLRAARPAAAAAGGGQSPTAGRTDSAQTISYLDRPLLTRRAADSLCSGVLLSFFFTALVSSSF